MKVLLLLEYASLNGGEHSLLCLLPGLQQQGYEFISVAPPTGAVADALARLSIETIPLKIEDSSGNRLDQTQRRAELASIVERVNPALIHANSLAMTRLSGPVVAPLRIPSVGHVRDMVKLSRQAVRDCNEHACLVAVSEATRNWHVGQGFDAQRMVVAYNGVDLAKFQPRPATGHLHARLQLPANAILLGGVGQIGMRKGWDVLLAALQGIDLDRHPLHLVVAGERHSTKAEAVDYEESLYAAASTGKLRGRVHFVGRMNDMPAFYNELQLLVHPARQEPLGRVLLEAAASGVPVIATEVGGTAEIFGKNPSTAWLVPPSDALPLTAAVEQWVNNPHEGTTRAAQARQRMQEHFSQPLGVERLTAIYHEIIAQR